MSYWNLWLGKRIKGILFWPMRANKFSALSIDLAHVFPPLVLWKVCASQQLFNGLQTLIGSRFTFPFISFLQNAQILRENYRKISDVYNLTKSFVHKIAIPDSSNLTIRTYKTTLVTELTFIEIGPVYSYSIHCEDQFMTMVWVCRLNSSSVMLLKKAGMELYLLK